MIIQAIRYGAAEKKGPFAFTYSGDFTDSRVDGIGDVTLNTSGTLVTTGKTVTVRVYILGAGGGGAQRNYSTNSYDRRAGGGSGGNQTVEIELAPGTYEIVIGIGGVGDYTESRSAVLDGATAGGNTTAFGYTSTGGGPASITTYSNGNTPTAGYGGSPNGNGGATGTTSGGNGGEPNGGSGAGGSAAANKGGNGLVRITFS